LTRHEEEQAGFDRKAGAAAPYFGCCLLHSLTALAPFMSVSTLLMWNR
jgi:hypothetical protein